MIFIQPIEIDAVPIVIAALWSEDIQRYGDQARVQSQKTIALCRTTGVHFQDSEGEVVMVVRCTSKES